MGRARVRTRTLIGAAALLGGLVACTPPGTGGGGGPTTTIATTTTVPAGCTDTPTPVIGGYPLAVPATGWYSSDTRQNGNVRVDATLPAPPGFGCNSVRLNTGNNVIVSGSYQDKAQLFSYALVGMPLGTINTISYLGYKSSASGPNPAATALNVQISGTTVPGNFATLVYESYNQSGGNAAIALDTWQPWDATATTPGDGVWWSTKIPSGPGSQSSPQTWAAMQALYSDASVVGYGFNAGSNNPNLVLGADGLTFGAITTNF